MVGKIGIKEAREAVIASLALFVISKSAILRPYSVVFPLKTSTNG